MAQLVCLGRHTLTGITATSGGADHDWTGQYRLYSHGRFDPDAVFAVARNEVLDLLSPQQPLVVAMDDSLLPKTGTHIPGVGWRRDPLGPRFQANLIRAQRVLQLSAALPSPDDGSARMVPIDFQHVPTAVKPKPGASDQEWTRYRQDCRKKSITRRGSQRLLALRQSLDADGLMGAASTRTTTSSAPGLGVSTSTSETWSVPSARTSECIWRGPDMMFSCGVRGV